MYMYMYIFFSEAFRGFPMIQELEIPLNGLRGIKLSPVDFPYLEVNHYSNITSRLSRLCYQF